MEQSITERECTIPYVALHRPSNACRLSFWPRTEGGGICKISSNLSYSHASLPAAAEEVG